MCKYGYCRISTKKQSIERQERNIRKEFPNVDKIVKEEFTGTRLDRPEWSKLYKAICKQRKQGKDVTIIFDSVSRMSRNAEEGFQLYKELYNMGVSLVFLKERHIDTDAYKEAMQGIIATNIQSGDQATDDLVNSIMSAVNRFMMAKVEKDIQKGFEQAEKEVLDLRQRTKEGIETARLNGKQIGGVEGKKLTTKKSIVAKEEIMKHSKDFKGDLSDSDCMKLTGLSRNTFYKYKRELKEEF